MDVIIILLAALALAAAFDDLLGGPLGLVEEFNQGLASMGRLALSIVGTYCIGIALIQSNAAAIAAFAAHLPFDPSLIPSCLLCPDTGGLPIAQELAATPELGIYTGALVTSGLGATVGYQIPMFLSALDKKYFPALMRGFLYGLITLPVGLFAGGLLLGLPITVWLQNTAPVLLLCVLLMAAFLAAASLTVRVLSALGMLIRVLTYVLFAAVVADIFLPQVSIVDQELIYDALLITFRSTVVICGGLVLSKLAIKYCNRPLNALAKLLGVNIESVIGLVLCCFQSMAMLPLFPKMSPKGKIMNAAFCVCGAYLLGSQMAFITKLVPHAAAATYMVNKILCGITAILLVCAFEHSPGSKKRTT